MHRTLPFLAALLLVLAGCAQTGTTSGPSSPAPSGDVVVDGVSILGVWNAVGALDESDVDADLRNGMLSRTLVINPRGRVVLTGEDARAGTGRESFEGRISGNRLTFEQLPGAATIAVRNDGRLVLTDPRGNRTVYERD